jgi:hypothetical protein
MTQRRNIINAIGENLKACQHFNWVRNTRLIAYPAIDNNLPGITYYTEHEAAESLTIHPQPRPQLRRLTLTVKCWVQNGGTGEQAEDQMDIQSERIEEVMVNDINGITDLTLISTEYDVDEAEPNIHAIVLTYQLDYVASELAQATY